VFKIREELFITDFHRLFKENGLTPDVIKLFQDIIYEYYKNFKRKFLFRENITPYNVLVSEIMLQQTQTGRVSEKFLKFIKKFPDFLSLSQAPLEEILTEWKGLGYNRRAIALRKIAEIVINDYNGKLPESIEELILFPQIGHNTASSIITFAFNKPEVFIETNIRKVFIYFFFPNKNKINDKEILPLIEKTLDRKNPRRWYYSLMDYGVMLKKKFPYLMKKSTHYRKQTPFEGSDRQLRGELLRLLINKRILSIDKVMKLFKSIDPNRIGNILHQLESEGFIKNEGNIITISK
jgi:A/G-specific adenine glycosylase